MNRIFSILFFCFLCFVTFGSSISCVAKENADFDYNEFYYSAKEFDETNLLEGVITPTNKQDIIPKKIFNEFVKEMKNCWLTFFCVVFISMMCALVKIFVNKPDLGDACSYVCYCICAATVLTSFKMLSKLCTECIDDLSDFMNIAMPTYVTVLASSGYVSLATSTQSLFMVICVFIANIIKKIICPLLFCTGIISIVGALSNAIDLSRFIKLISKTVKYILGIIMTIFAGMLAFGGFASSASDNIALQTAKYAVANFVPVVGNCLSGALNSVINSSLAIKANLGLVGFITLVSICIIPLIKIFVCVFSFRLGASVSQMITDTKVSNMLDLVSDVLVTFGAMVVLVMVVFVLVIGVISSVG